MVINTIVMPNIQRIVLSERFKAFFFLIEEFSHADKHTAFFYISDDEFGWPDAGQRIFILFFTERDERGQEATSANRNRLSATEVTWPSASATLREY
jgi:hypothetical protein